MKQIVQFVTLICFYINYVHSSKLPGPLVYVVTPSSKSPQINTGRASPFYFHNWVRRMDGSDVVPSSTTTTAKTPDLIFAEFESGNDNMKSIRQLLEKEKFQSKRSTTSTSRPIYVPDEVTSASDSNLPQTTSEKPTNIDMTDYFALYNNLHDSGLNYVPSAPPSSVATATTSTPIITTTSQATINNVENIWHIIDNQKHENFAGGWEEVTTIKTPSEETEIDQTDEEKWKESHPEDEKSIDDNFAIPGFGTNPGSGAENESRAIRTEPNIRFPYINLKPFKMKNLNSKKGNNMLNLDNLTVINYPTRGEVQDINMVPLRQPIDRYNPAQPYLPTYGTKSKQPSGPPATAPPVSPPQTPTKVFANLVPPPPPPASQVTADDFPIPSTYESFPPYAPGGSGSGSTFSFPPSGASGPDSSTGDSNGPSYGYKYKPASLANQPLAPSPPAPSAPTFIPTLPPLSKPFSGYSYDKPPTAQDPSDMDPSDMDMDDKPDFNGYHYSKPAPLPSPPSQPSSPSEHDYHNYGHHDSPPFQSGPDYPELVFDKPHGMGDMKGGETGKENDMGMMPPPLADTKPDPMGPPMDDHGFPHDFPGDFKYSHDFDDHDYHHHHHYPTTTTTTTEQPRVNRYSYYYLGKKLYYLPLYFSVYFIVYVGALIIKAVLRHKITYPNSFRPNDKTASFFSKRSIESHLSSDNLHEITSRVTKAIATAAEKYIDDKSKKD